MNYDTCCPRVKSWMSSQGRMDIEEPTISTVEYPGNEAPLIHDCDSPRQAGMPIPRDPFGLYLWR